MNVLARLVANKAVRKAVVVLVAVVGAAILGLPEDLITGIVQALL
jgi:hypothetical protein